MDLQLTQGLAIWGAVVSTIALAWQVFQWMRNHPRIIAKVEVKERMGSEWINFELRNRGGKASTVEEIMFVRYSGWFAKCFHFPNGRENLSAYHSDSIKLPVVLQPGELWKGHCPLTPENEHTSHGESRKDRFERSQLFFRIRCAHTDRLISGAVQREGFLDRM